MKLEFHHVGVACESLDAETRRFAELGYRIEGRDFSDPLQGVVGRFLIGGGPRLELLHSTLTKGVLDPWLRSNVKFYHLAYETAAFAEELGRLRAGGAKAVVNAVPAVAFNGRNIAFLLLPNMALVELIEK